MSVSRTFVTGPLCFTATVFLFYTAGFCQVAQVRMVPATPLQSPSKSSMTAGVLSAVPTAATSANASSDVERTDTEDPNGGNALEQTKVDLLLKEKFDRTAPSMLKAWSTNAPDSNSQSDLKHCTAYVENVFKNFVFLSFDTDVEFEVGEIVDLFGNDIGLGRLKILTVDAKAISGQWVQVSRSKSPASPTEQKTTIPSPSSEETDHERAPKSEEPSTTEPSTTEPSTTEPSTTEPSTTEPSTTEPSTTEPSTTEPSTTEPSTTEPSTTEPSTTLQEPHTEEISPPTVDGIAASMAEEPIDANETSALKAGELVEVRRTAASPDSVDPAQQAKREVETFVRDVTLGHWGAVKTFLSAMDAEQADKVYAHLLKSLATAPPVPGANSRNQMPPKPHLTPADILQLADAAPKTVTITPPITATQEKAEKAAATVPATANTNAAPAISLPPGATMESLPPEVAAALAQSAGVPEAASPTQQLNHIAALARLVRNSREVGYDFSDFLKNIEAGTRDFGGQDPDKRLVAAMLFVTAGMNDFVEQFLPSLEEESIESNISALKIWSRLALARHREKKIATWLEKAWNINQWILVIDDLGSDDRDRAVSNLIELSPQVEKEIGVAWMNASFTELPSRGMMILSNLGSQSAQLASKAAQTSETTRLKLLRLQNDAVEKLLEVSPDTADQWRQSLTLLAQNWLTEANISLTYSTQNSRNAGMQIDMYGNFYWANQNQRSNNGRRPRPIKLGDIIEAAPSAKWQSFIDPSLHTNVRQTKARLHLRVNEEDQAFPFIEQIAAQRPELARDLVHEFLRSWTRNHDPNTDKRNRNPYIYFYGFDQKADAIPLTRSKQERNLKELAGWIDRIRRLPIEDVDEKLLAGAFMTCHSSAEVFQLQRFRTVFGELDTLKPETVAEICEKMRASLASNWRDIRNQEAKQTNRREPEVQQEVLQGYETGMKLIEEALKASPENWQLHLAKAALMYEQNAYAQTVQKSSEFSDRRDAAFKQFENAADMYAKAVNTLEEKEQVTDVFDTWFYAGMGACDLGRITDKTVPDLRQYKKIRKAIETLPGHLAESHMAKFANNLFTRMSPIKPEIKFRYLRGGFEIVGDHPRAWEAKNLFEYYQDLVHEIQLDVNIDGDDNVGHDSPFGVYVNIMHTAEIERESGGFGKYVQNQNSMLYSFNYGRPTENYRDKFNDAVGLALGEHFEVLSVTFQSADQMKSRPAAKPGWRVTPYAYVLLKPRGPQIDRIAPLKLDLDFLDTSGYVVIPVESPALVVDCSADNPTLRPIGNLKITQTLDERQADDGKLIVEISATADGLVPDLEEILDLKKDNFEVVSVDDQGVLPTAFDKVARDIQIVSDRSWTVEYKAKESERAISDFKFSDAMLETTEAKFQRYEDADLVQVEQSVNLEKNYVSLGWGFLRWLIPLTVLALVAAAGFVYMQTKPKVVVKQKFLMPTDVNPFTVLTLLKDIKERNGISPEQGRELDASIEQIEEQYFGERTADQPRDLAVVAKSWLKQAN